MSEPRDSSHGGRVRRPSWSDRISRGQEFIRPVRQPEPTQTTATSETVLEINHPDGATSLLQAWGNSPDDQVTGEELDEEEEVLRVHSFAR